MKILYLVNMNENNRKGLFTVAHERIKEMIKSDTVEDYDIYSIQFWDVGIRNFLKKIMGKTTTTKGSDKFDYENVEYKKIYLKTGLFSKLIERTNFDVIRYLPFLKKYEEVIKSCDVVSVPWGYPHGRIGYWINKLYKKPYIVTYYGSDIHTMPYQKKHIKKKINEVMDNAHFNMFVSNGLYENAKELGYKKDNYMVINNGVNPEKFYTIDEEEIDEIKKKINLSGKIIGFTGNLNTVKRADKLIEIFDHINIISKEEVSFLVVGDGPLRDGMEKDAKDKNLNIFFSGNVKVDDVRNYMNVMDMMLLPSRNEGFGCVVLEANACGTRVIGSDVGGICEAVRNDELIVSEGDDFELRMAKKTVDILNQSYDKNKLIEDVKNGFTWSAIAQHEINVYKGVQNE
ncbi:glycosyltransferase [Metaclostridioides mangenotii]|uniref:glycosyltransferase n=1 Tax=Metaclostridioides mangenotii TaxID=1540 RepID=UPI0028ED73A8|nr:glycosyltransferase [Clostridioides mangenotii]